MTVAPTSIAVYHALQSEGALSKRQEQIMGVIRAGRDYSLQELSFLAGLPINVVSGRVNELKGDKLRRLEHAPKRKCTLTGRWVQPVRMLSEQAGEVPAQLRLVA